MKQPSKRAATKPSIEPKPAKKATENKPGAIDESHQQRFDQLLDDAVLGVPKPKKR